MHLYVQYVRTGDSYVDNQTIINLEVYYQHTVS